MDWKLRTMVLWRCERCGKKRLKGVVRAVAHAGYCKLFGRSQPNENQ